MATIASPTTRAAGTAATSLRSTWAFVGSQTVEIHGRQRGRECGDGLHRCAQNERHAVGHAPFQSSGSVGPPHDPSAPCVFLARRWRHARSTPGGRSWRRRLRSPLPSLPGCFRALPGDAHPAVRNRSRSHPGRGRPPNTRSRTLPPATRRQAWPRSMAAHMASVASASSHPVRELSTASQSMAEGSTSSPAGALTAPKAVTLPLTVTPNSVEQSLADRPGGHSAHRLSRAGPFEHVSARRHVHTSRPH